MFTSQNFSKKLKEGGCELNAEMWWAECKTGGWNKKDWHWVITDDLYEGDYTEYRNKTNSYDILNDICVKYAKEFFSIKLLLRPNTITGKNGESMSVTEVILDMLQQNKPQEEIEAYIWDNCLFNPANKL